MGEGYVGRVSGGAAVVTLQKFDFGWILVCDCDLLSKAFTPGKNECIYKIRKKFFLPRLNTLSRAHSATRKNLGYLIISAIIAIFIVDYFLYSIYLNVHFLCSKCG